MGSGGEGCYSRLRKNKCLQIFVFFVLSALNIADLISDWLLFHDVDAAEEGLVFGPPDKKIWIALLFFSVLGAVLFTIEILNLGKGIFTSKPWIDTDIMSAFIIWLEDIPQITINCVILACREEAISVFQISKASVVILGAIIRMIIGIVRACRRSSSSNIEKFKQCNTFKFIMFFGLTLMVCGSVTVFMFAQSSFKRDGSFEFKTPRNLWEGEYNDQKYFDRVGVYGNLGFLDNGIDNNSTKKSSHPAHSHWMQFFRVYDIHHETDVIKVNITFDAESRQNFRIQTFFSDAFENNTDECYHVNQTEWQVFTDQNCENFARSNSTKERIHFKFSYVKPRNHLILGDIQYNVKGTLQGSCLSASELNIKPTKFKADKIMSSNYEIVLRYFQVNEPYKSSGHVVESSTGQLTFYDPKRHLVDINEVWRTGFLGCENTGSVSPHLNTQENVEC